MVSSRRQFFKVLLAAAAVPLLPAVAPAAVRREPCYMMALLDPDGNEVSGDACPRALFVYGPPPRFTFHKKAVVARARILHIDSDGTETIVFEDRVDGRFLRLGIYAGDTLAIDHFAVRTKVNSLIRGES